MDWSNIALYAFLTIVLAATMLGLTAFVTARWLRPKRQNVEKLDPYECGVPVLSSTHQRFSVHFYLVAILFILFDIETVFLIPWAVLYQKLGLFGLAEMGIFLGIVTGGLIYIWRRGALEWD